MGLIVNTLDTSLSYTGTSTSVIIKAKRERERERERNVWMLVCAWRCALHPLQTHTLRKIK
jgi:hypothetical protein